MEEQEFNDLIEALKVDVRLCEDMIGEVADDVIVEGFSQYPVFIATEHQIQLGETIVDKDDMAGRFNINATTLESLLEKRLILPERKTEFIKAWKNPKQYMCFMLVTPEIASIAFIPYSQRSRRT